MRKKAIALAAVELIILLALLFKCFGQEEAVYDIRGKDIGDQIYMDEKGVYVFTDGGIALSPGVYQVRVESSIKEEQLISVKVICNAGYYKSLQENTVHIRPYENDMDFEVYVLDTIPNAGIRCEFRNATAADLYRLQICRTTLGNRMLLVVAAFLFGVVDALLYWGYCIRTNEECRKRQYIVWVLLGASLVAFYPYLSDYMCAGADTLFHILRMEGLKESFINGCPLPVRVQDYWLYHHGYAVSLFYGDLFLVIPALLRIAGFSIMTVYKTFLFSVILATAVVAYLSFVKCVNNRNAALFGTVLYTLAPYHVMDLYNRGAIGECLALVFMPLVCCGVYLLLSKDTEAADYKYHKWWLVLGMTCLLQSHLLSTEMVSCMIAVACIVFWKKTFRKKTFVQFVQAVLITVLINFWFLIPMVFMLSKDTYKLSIVLDDSMQSRGAAFSELLQLLPHTGGGIRNYEPIHVGFAAFIVVAVAILFLWKKKKYPAEKFLSVSAVILLALTTKYAPWDMLMGVPVVGSFVSSLQFPTRWLLIIMVLVAMLAAFVYQHLQAEHNIWVFRLTVLAVYFVMVGSAVYLVNDYAYFKEPMRLYSAENIGGVSVVNGEYLLGDSDLLDFYPHEPVAEEGLTWSEYNKKGTDITIMVSNAAGTAKRMELPVIGYRGYAVEAQGSETPDELCISEERGAHGDLTVMVPPNYTGLVHVWYKGFGIFRVAEIVSIVSLLGCVLYYLKEANVFVKIRDAFADDEELETVNENL